MSEAKTTLQEMLANIEKDTASEPDILNVLLGEYSVFALRAIAKRSNDKYPYPADRILNRQAELFKRYNIIAVEESGIYAKITPAGSEFLQHLCEIKGVKL